MTDDLTDRERAEQIVADLFANGISYPSLTADAILEWWAEADDPQFAQEQTS